MSRLINICNGTTMLKLPHQVMYFFTLHTLKKMRNFTLYKLRKHTAKSLVLSKLDYNDIVFDPLPQYFMKQLRVQNAAASFVLWRYANSTDCINIGWLLVVQRRKLHLLKATFKALNDPRWPSYAVIQRANPNHKLRSSSIVHLTTPLVSERNVCKVWLRDELKKRSSQLLDNVRDCLTC